MDSTNTVGMYGKIPALGDFVSRNLPLQFTTGLDQWIQQCLLVSQQSLGPAWLEAYLTSPVWRFVFSTGVMGADAWAGVMIPSVDKVGRYYPLILVQQLPDATPPTLVMVEDSHWFDQLEQTALLALQEGVTLVALESQLQQQPAMISRAVSQKGRWDIGRPLAISTASQHQKPLNVYPILLHDLLQQRLSCYSLWWSAGSDKINPAQLVVGYLPSPQNYTSFLVGDWESRGWSHPFPTVSPLAFMDNTCDNKQDNHNE